MNDQKRAILAVVLSGFILLVWQYYFVPSPVSSDIISNVSEKSPLSDNTLNTKITNSSLPKVSNSISDLDPDSLKSFILKNSNASFYFNNNLCFTNSSNSNSGIGAKEVFNSEIDNLLCLEFYINQKFQNVYFDTEIFNDSNIQFSSEAHNLNISLSLFSDAPFLNIKISSPDRTEFRFVFNSVKKKLDNGQISSFVYFTDSLSTIEVGDSDKGDKNLNWFGLDFNYHLFSVVLNSSKNSLFETFESNSFKIKPSQVYDEISNESTFKLFYAKKEYDYLLSQKFNLHQSVDFGIWSIVAVPILRGLQFFYSLFPNWGISIILLTILIRLITFPLQYKSIKSMKKMQVIQPQLAEIREKHKDNPQVMQQETMKLFKVAGANPLGGCLPLILQMPIFFAFYKVLYTSVELVNAPFYGWITDLSEKDPYYILPILMSIAMFLHQKLTPTATADPMQQKVLMFMPLIFGIFMKDLPAGLTLYIFVSTVFALLQQVLVFKNAK